MHNKADCHSRRLTRLLRRFGNVSTENVEATAEGGGTIKETLKAVVADSRFRDGDDSKCCGECLKSDCNLHRHSTYCLRTTAGPAMLRLCKSLPSFDVVHVVLAAATCRTHTRQDKLRCCMPRAAYLLGVYAYAPPLLQLASWLCRTAHTHCDGCLSLSESTQPRQGNRCRVIPFHALYKACHLEHTFVRSCNP